VSAPKSQVVTREADLSKAQPPRWAWRHRFVIGYLNLLIGEEGAGKGTLISLAIARWTQGKLHGDLYGKRVHVGILGDEDSFDDTWTPRLHAAGADLSRVHLIERRDGGYVDVKRDRRALTREIKRHHIRILFLDQLLDNLGTGVDDWRQKAVRDALQPFRSIAAELDIAVIGALHPNKRADTFRRMVAGSGAFNAVSRSSLLLALHPEDETRRVLVRGKGNLSKLPDTLTFSIKSHTFAANGVTFSVPVAYRFERSDLTAKDLVAATERPSVVAQSKQGDARALIGQLLPRDGEWHPSKPIFETCDGAGLDHKTVMRAKRKLGIEHRRTETFPAYIEWRWATEPTLNPHAGGVLSVPSVSTTTEDSKDSEDTASTSPQCVLAGGQNTRRDNRKNTGKHTRKGQANRRTRASVRKGAVV
jgi:putative DNA primase/helicase